MQKVIELSDEKVAAIGKYVEEHPVDVYIDYRDELSKEQVNQVLEGKSDEVRWEIESDYSRYMDRDDYYWKELRDELDITEEQLDMWFDSDECFWPSYNLDDYDWDKLIKNSNIHVSAVMWDANFDLYDLAYGGPLVYQDVRDSLKVLGVNPKEFRDLVEEGGYYKVKGYFPNMPNRVPKVDVKKLYGEILVLYNGVLTFAVGDLENVTEVMKGDSKYVTFKKGTNVVMYDFGNGAGIVDVPLIEDVTVKRSEVDFRNDDDFQYGMEECYGFGNAYWQEGSVRNGK